MQVLPGASLTGGCRCLQVLPGASLTGGCSSLQVDILFTASAMDPVSALFLEQLDVPFVKVGSGDADNLPMIAEIAERGRPVVVSTGQ